jgi:hypothetical protein
MTEQQHLQNQLAKFKGLDVLAHTDGGKTLLASLRRSIANDVESIISLVKADEVSLRVAVAKLMSDLTIYRLLVNAEENVKITEEELEALLQSEKES